MADRFVLPRWQALDAIGTALPGAKLYTYLAGTYTPKPTYTDAALTVAHPNPIVADAAGRFPDIFPEEGLYRLRLETAANVLVWEADDVEGKASGLDAYLLRNGSLPMTGSLLIAPGDNEGIRVDGNASTWIRQPTSQPNVWEIGTGGAARLTVTNDEIEAHKPLIVPAATAAEHAPRWEQVWWTWLPELNVTSAAGPFEFINLPETTREILVLFRATTLTVDVHLVQIGNTTFATSGYASFESYVAGTTGTGSSGRNNGFIARNIQTNNPVGVCYITSAPGQLFYTAQVGGTSSSLPNTNASNCSNSVGHLAWSEPLTRVRLVLASGTMTGTVLVGYR